VAVYGYVRTEINSDSSRLIGIGSSMNDGVSIWAKGIFWLCGLCNALLGAMCGYSLFSSVYWVHMRYRSHPLAPYFWAAFAVMELINVAFLSTLLLAAFQLFRLKPSAVSMHSVASAALVGYAILNGMLWLIPGSIGTSIAAASGVGNMGIAPLLLWSGVPALYPVASTIVLQCAATDAMEVSAPTEMVVTRTCGR
jgi:hypothetical protein